nr:MAG TPA: hypothetical protein [Caudoviricetes sp.]
MWYNTILVFRIHIYKVHIKSINIFLLYNYENIIKKTISICVKSI